MIHSVNKDCEELSGLGHFLKGSSAALGVTKVQKSCELIQNYGKLKDEGGLDITAKVALDKISAALKETEEQFKEAKAWLRNWYKTHGRTTLGDEKD